jgi:protein TonB
MAAAPSAPGIGNGSGGVSGAGAGTTGSAEGIGGTHEGPGDDYLERVRRWLARYKQYPEAAKEAKQEGRVVISFKLRADGTVLEPRVERSSGFPLLDAAAIEMLQRASPVPPPPIDPTGRGPVELPVTYSLALLDKVF